MPKPNVLKGNKYGNGTGTIRGGGWTLAKHREIHRMKKTGREKTSIWSESTGNLYFGVREECKGATFHCSL